MTGELKLGHMVVITKGFNAKFVSCLFLNVKPKESSFIQEFKVPSPPPYLPGIAPAIFMIPNTDPACFGAMSCGLTRIPLL